MLQLDAEAKHVRIADLFFKSRGPGATYSG